MRSGRRVEDMRIAIAVLTIAILAVPLLGTAGDRHPDHDFLWLQGPDPEDNAYASQFPPDAGWYAEIAADFVALETAEINHIHWWGQRFPVTRDGRPVMSVRRVEWGGGGERSLDCTGAILTGCNVVLTGDNTGGPNNVDYYSCSGWLEDGPEVVYELLIPFDGTNLTVTIGDLFADLDIFLLSHCDEGTCITYGHFDFNVTVDAGIYYLVVDGWHGAVSSYTLTIECQDVPPLYFAVRFYDHVVDEPGDLLYEVYVGDIHETPFERYELYSYWADIPPFPVVDGEHYWISIQSVMNQSPFGQWFWQRSDFSALEWPVWDADIFGFTRWTSLPEAVGTTGDMAFGLAHIDTPVEARSWGVIKALYR
jgi:hypothetical protein